MCLFTTLSHNELSENVPASMGGPEFCGTNWAHFFLEGTFVLHNRAQSRNLLDKSLSPDNAPPFRNSSCWQSSLTWPQCLWHLTWYLRLKPLRIVQTRSGIPSLLSNGEPQSMSWVVPEVITGGGYNFKRGKKKKPVPIIFFVFPLLALRG